MLPLFAGRPGESTNAMAWMLGLVCAGAIGVVALMATAILVHLHRTRKNNQDSN